MCVWFYNWIRGSTPKDRMDVENKISFTDSSSNKMKRNHEVLVGKGEHGRNIKITFVTRGRWTRT